MRIKIINILSKKQLVDRSCKNTIRNKFNLDLIYTNLDLIYTNLDLAYTNLDFVQNNLDLVQTVSDFSQITLDNLVLLKYYIQIFLYIIILKRKQVNNSAENLEKYRNKIVCAIAVFIT